MDGLLRPAAVICDLDGTLVDTVPTRIAAWLTTFAEFDLAADPDQVAALIGSDGRWLSHQVAERAGRPLTDVQAEVVDRRAGEVYGALNTQPVVLPGATAFLDALDHAGMPWAIATSSRPDQVQTSVSALGRPSPPVVVDGHAVAHAKPAPDLLLHAAAVLGVAPAACWCVGDSVWDIRAARAAVMTAIGVTTGAASADDLTDAGAVLVVVRLDALAGAVASGVTG
jgi:HAD superfamily hydrolase (TIGR01509 family)